MGVNALKSHAIGDRHHFILQEQEKISFFFTGKSNVNNGMENSKDSPSNFNNTVTTELDKKSRYAKI